MIDYMEKIIMKCPKCESYNITAVETRNTSLGRVRRRRKCLDCGHSFTTYEVYSEDGASDSISPEMFKRDIKDLKKDKLCKL